MLRQACRRDDQEAIGIDNLLNGEIDIYYLTRDTQALGDVVKREIVGTHVFTSFTTSLAALIQLASFMKAEIVDSPPNLQECFDSGRSVAISIFPNADPNGPTQATAVFMRRRIPEDPNEPTELLAIAVSHRITDDHITIKMGLSKNIAWAFVSALYAKENLEEIASALLGMFAATENATFARLSEEP